MQFQLTKEHDEWLRGEVAAGRIASLEEAIGEAVDNLKNDDDLSWAKLLVDEGLSELDRGKAIPAEDVFARVEARLRATR